MRELIMIQKKAENPVFYKIIEFPLILFPPQITRLSNYLHIFSLENTIKLN
jgi:hypothetical protein